MNRIKLNKREFNNLKIVLNPSKNKSFNAYIIKYQQKKGKKVYKSFWQYINPFN